MEAEQNLPADPVIVPQPAGEKNSSTALDAAALYTSPIVTIRLGRATDAPEFQVHRQLMVHHSTRLRSQCQSSATVELYDVSRDASVMLVDWLYKEKLAPLRDWEKKYGCASNASFDDRLTAAYIFAHKYCVSGLQIALLKLAVPYFTKTAPALPAITEAFHHLPKRCQFLRLLVDAFCINGGPKNLHTVSGVGAESDSGSTLPTRFLILVAKKYAEIAKNTVKTMNLRSADYISGASLVRGPPAKKQKIMP